MRVKLLYWISTLSELIEAMVSFWKAWNASKNHKYPYFECIRSLNSFTIFYMFLSFKHEKKTFFMDYNSQKYFKSIHVQVL